MKNLSKKESQTVELKKWLGDLKSRIRQSQIKAAIKVNSELLHLYWDLGHDIVVRQMESVWGSKFFEHLSRELKSEFPDMNGFSPTNLKYCKYFFQFYSQDSTIRQQLADELENRTIFQIPWFHNVQIFTKCKSVTEALFYIQKTIENGWSRATLMNFMDANLYSSQGKALTNFERLLPKVQSDLAKETLKTKEFEPEHAGKLGFYIAAVNNQLKKDIDNPTIGILICKTKDNVEVQYSLESSNQPIGISEYTLSKLIPDNFKSSLPSIEEIEQELNKK